MEESFVNFDELKSNIERGGEIEFIYHGKHFSITHFEENGQHKVSVMQAYNYDSEKVYDIAKTSNIRRVFARRAKTEKCDFRLSNYFQMFLVDAWVKTR